MSPHPSAASPRPQPITQGTQSTVFGIIAAFTSGLDVLKKFRAQDRGRRRGQPRQTSADEVQLSKSLRNSPVEIHDRYERGYNAFSTRFADGDVVAQASLTGTLLKLNSGLVEIVSAFLANPKSKSHCDFTPLIKLSDDSRREAVHALNQLYQRLSTSQPSRPLPSRRHSSQETKSKRTKASKQSSSSQVKNNDKPRKTASAPALNSKGAPVVTTVSKVHVKGFKAPQYAFTRPRGAKRSSSGSSSSASSAVSSNSNSSQSTAVTTPSSSPSSSPHIGTREDSPPPQYVSDPHADPYTRPPPPAAPRPKFFPAQIRQTPYFSGARTPSSPEMFTRGPTASPLLPSSRQPYPHSTPALVSPSQPQPQPQSRYYPSDFSPSSSTLSSSQTLVPSRTRSTHKAHYSSSTNQFPAPNPRASVAYSFASDSTKLGEIPLHRWTEPAPDFDAFALRNREAALVGPGPRGPPPVPEPVRRKGGGGFWSLFKKGGFGT
ncbi:MAG: hypothetical protein M1821_004175 [Bathelium mastoideum]|nr:MAG: hypothetical protein M1821_004175 [Bathelium mastoideum]KAI9685435.1 MAG: hypothetical protein M1822_004566 [Bathelium mastoideum]